MKLDTDLIRKVCDPNGIFGESLFGPASSQYIDWMLDKGVPPDALAELTTFSLKDESGASCITLDPEQDIISFNNDFTQFLDEGLLAVGSCPNGDIVVIDINSQTGEAGYVSHEEMYEAKPLRSVYIPLEKTFGRLLWELETHDVDDYPCDYYDAKERLEPEN